MTSIPCRAVQRRRPAAAALSALAMVLALAPFATVSAPAAPATAPAAPPAATATTMLESTLPGGEFSGDWRSPTVVGPGIGTIGGTGGVGSDDYFLFTGLPAGAQSLVLTFSAPGGIGYSYSAGGTVLHDTRPFAHEWAGTHSGTVQLDHHTRQQSITLALPGTFAGTLYLALNFTHGADIAYSLSAPSNARAAPGPGRKAPWPWNAPPYKAPLPGGLILAGEGPRITGPRR